jgi:peptide/nickel transport system permease protein
MRGEPFIVVVGLIAITLVALSAGASLFFPHADPNNPDFARVLAAPSWLGGKGGLLGYDNLGRPMWIRVLYGLRTSYVIAVFSVLAGGAIGVCAGLISGYRGGWIDSVVSHVADIQMSFPTLLLIMTILGALGGSATTLIIVLALSSWMLYSRVVRSIILQQRSTDFVGALVALGATPQRVMLRHLLPNAIPAIVSVGTIELARLMLAESTLSFLGFGIQPPTISLGAILAEGEDYAASAWWVSTFAGLFLAIAVLTTNLLGNWLERTSDPLAQARRLARLQ